MHTTRTPRNWKTAVSALALAGAGVIGFGAVAAASYGDEPPVVEDTTDTTDDTGNTDDAGDETGNTATDAVFDDTDGAPGTDDGPEGLAALDGEPGRRGHRGLRSGEAVAEVLGMTVDELRDRRSEGLSIAAIAEQQGIAVDLVIDAIVDDVEERLDDKVAAGDLTQADADERLASAADRAAAQVERVPGEGCGDDADATAETTDT